MSNDTTKIDLPRKPHSYTSFQADVLIEFSRLSNQIQEITDRFDRESKRIDSINYRLDDLESVNVEKSLKEISEKMDENQKQIAKHSKILRYVLGCLAAATPLAKIIELLI